MSKISLPKLRLYLDTTIPNYIFSEHYLEKRDITLSLIREIKSGKYEGYVSDVVLREVGAAPEPLLTGMMAQIKDFHRLKSIEESEKLSQSYVKDKIFPAKSIDDARHVAIATINNIDAVVSWNFGHLVNIVKVKKVNIVNEIMGYKHIEIISPQEVIHAKG